MALNKDERRALKFARNVISRGDKYSYICIALDEISINEMIDVRRLKSYINNALDCGIYGTLLTWQRKNGFHNRNDKQLREDRVAWIDWMLDQPEIE